MPMIAMTNLMMNAMIRFLERLPDGTRALPDLLPSVIRDGIVSPLMAIGLLSIVCAMVLREGPLFRAFRIAIVTSHGRPASRARTLLRAVVGWGPFVLCGIGMVNHTALIVNPEASAFLRGPLPPVVFVVLLIGGIAAALITPQRALQDRIVGTYLVPSE
jgi:hypothetical protein